jgi:hypothetical protein
MTVPETDALPVTALLAPEPGRPVIIFDSNAALRMAIIDRGVLRALDDSWDVPGVYLLLDPVTFDGEWSVYVGRAPAGLRSRLRDHLRKKDHWNRALLVVRDTTHGWHSAQVGWLEGRLYDLLDGATLATLSNGNRPQDETLPAYERAALEAAVEPIAAVLRLLGCSPDVLDDDTQAGIAASSSIIRRRYTTTVTDLLRAGLLEPGEELVSTIPRWPATGHVDADGGITTDGQTFHSLSAAGGHIRRGHATNGWSYWGVERDGSTVPLATLRARYERQQTGSAPSEGNTAGGD